MAFRFQRRFKIAPGLTLVASKRGLGVSAGVPGARVSLTRAGLYGHAGLPGTGLAYRKKLNPKGRGRAASGVAPDFVQRIQQGSDFALTLRVEEGGDVTLLDADGLGFSDDEARFLRRSFGDALRERLRELCERKNAELESLRCVHYDTPAPRAAPVFEPREFALPRPTPPGMTEANFWSTTWPPARRRHEAENAARQAAFESASREWQAARDAFMAAEAERRARETRGVFTDLEAMALTLEDHLAEIPWPRETAVDLDLGDDSRTIAITLHLPDEEAMPAEEWSVPRTRFRVTKRRLSATRRRGLYRDYIHGVAVRVLGEVFARLPTIEAALVTGVVPGVDPATGHPAEIALFSVIARREQWIGLNFDALEAIDPAETLALFELRRNMTKTGMMRPIEAFSLEAFGA